MRETICRRELWGMRERWDEQRERGVRGEDGLEALAGSAKATCVAQTIERSAGERVFRRGLVIVF